MKLRSIILASAVASSMVAGAAPLESNNTFARLKVDSTLKSEIIAIPFAGCGESTAQIYVTNLVMTTGLANGDTLMYKNGNSWYAWEIDDGNWVAISTSKDGKATKAGFTFTPSAGSTALACGKACWLIRNNPTAYYLYGQVNGSMPASVKVDGAASEGKVAYTIVAKPKETDALDLNTWKGDKGMSNGDTLIVPADNAEYSTTYYYNGSAWCTNGVTRTVPVVNPRTKVETTKDVIGLCPISSSVTIPAGKGFLYGRKGTSDATLQW